MDDVLGDVASGDLASVQARIGANRSLLNARRAVWPGTALECATFYGHLPIARYLLGEGAQVNEGDGSGSPALRQACRGGSYAMVKLLLEAGADAVTPNEWGDTPLMYAATSLHVGIIRSLLAHGCGDIDARDRGGCTALWWACDWELAEAVLVLLKAGADWCIADRTGTTPLAVARRERSKGCVAVLEVSSAHTGVGTHTNRNHPLPRLPSECASRQSRCGL
jgi:ankyrin repeat protein